MLVHAEDHPSQAGFGEKGDTLPLPHIWAQSSLLQAGDLQWMTWGTLLRLTSPLYSRPGLPYPHRLPTPSPLVPPEQGDSVGTLNCIHESFSNSSCPTAGLRVLVPAWSGSQAWVGQALGG